MRENQLIAAANREIKFCCQEFTWYSLLNYFEFDYSPRMWRKSWRQ